LAGADGDFKLQPPDIRPQLPNIGLRERKLLVSRADFYDLLSDRQIVQRGLRFRQPGIESSQGNASKFAHALGKACKIKNVKHKKPALRAGINM